MINKGDTTWMLISTALVLMMSRSRRWHLFYGGLVRTKNMLSVLMQVFMIISIGTLVPGACWGYSEGVYRQFDARPCDRTILWAACQQDVPDGHVADATTVASDLLEQCLHPGIHLHRASR